MEFMWTALPELARRQTTGVDENDPAQKLLKLLQDPFNNMLQVGSIWASFGSSIGIAAGLALAFSFLRPYNTVVYAPKLKHADDAHAPPPLGKGIFAWVGPLWRTSELELVKFVGMDAALFLRFTRMCRNIFVTLAVLGCAILIPVNYNKSTEDPATVTWLMRLTPRNVWGEAQWAGVVVAWIFNLTICGFLWWNYRKVLQLRRNYFQSDEYQQSLHSRTLMLYDIPKNLSSDEGIARIIDEVAPSSSFSRTSVARNVKELPELIAEHDKTVRKLEKVLAKYLKDPQNLPPNRPQCEPSKKDRAYGTYARGQKLDAIDYLTQRIKDLELEIKEVRQAVDRRNTRPFGFASYSDISEAHAIAYAARKKKPHGTTITLAPRPNDIIWDNMPLSKATRSRRRFIMNLWVVFLTIIWIAPNAAIAMFLVNLSNLGSVWEGFRENLVANSGFWQVFQGIANPAITSLIYLVLPIIFRRLSIRAGDHTKTGRERHVTAKLYSFFIFNNLIIFSLFSSIWSFVQGVVNQTNKGVDAWQAIVKQNLMQTFLVSMCNISPFWVTWLLQRQMGAAIDLAQLWPLFWSFLMRKTSSPTPREMIELTAPPPFDYASYYNYFLYYATVTLCFAGIQPLVLPAAALYFLIDVVLKKYLLMYVFVTKTESGGMFWRVLFNRFIFGTILANLVVFMTMWVRGDLANHYQAYAIVPLPFIMIGFKIYCAKTFDTKIYFFSTRVIGGGDPEAGMAVGKESLRNDRLSAKFGHPALYKPLITPMVHAKAQNLLPAIYQGRLTDGREAGSGADTMSVSGYSDTYRLDNMKAGKVGKPVSAMPGFELVPESKLDFEFYKNRGEFADEHGGGDIFGIRPGTPSLDSTAGGPDSRPGTPLGGMTGRRQFSSSQTMRLDAPGPIGVGGYAPVAYPGQPSPYSMSSTGSGGAFPSPLGGPDGGPSSSSAHGRSPLYGMTNDSETNLVTNAARMSRSPPPMVGHPPPPVRSGSPARSTTPGGRSSTTGRDFGMDGVGGHSQTMMSHSSLASSSQVPHQRHQHQHHQQQQRAPGMLGGGPHGYGGLPQADASESAAGEQDPMTYDYFRGGSSSRRRA